MNKLIEDIVTGWANNSVKLEKLKAIEEDINVAKKIIRGEYKYCDECKDYYLAKSFTQETETMECKICTYEDYINSGGNEYADGYATITYSVCPKGHKHEIDRDERLK